MLTVIALTLAIFLLATLYSSVGHAGASGYLAAMALITQMPQEEMKGIALTLNIFVGLIGTWRFARAGHFHWPTFWPFAVMAVPLAFVGGLWQLPDDVFRPLIGAVLLFAAIMLIVRGKRREDKAKEPHMPPLLVALIAGAILGLMAGLTGTGGGIFLSPLLIICGWAGPKRTAAISIVFVLVNSIAGLGGVIAESPTLPNALPIYIVGAVLGGLLGSYFGARQLPGRGIKILLGVVLFIAAIKMFALTFGS